MKDLHKNQTVKCDAVEELLIKQNFERLSEDENTVLQNHLKTCNHCQNYQNQFASLQSSIKISEKSPLKPDPAIRQSLLNRMEALKPRKHRVIDSLWQKLLNLLEYRISVYQGLIGLACSILIFVVVHYLSFPNQHQPGSTRYELSIADTTFYQINVIKNLQIIKEQKIGKNVREDSLLTRFIVSSM
jgi:hypothetical protein